MGSFLVNLIVTLIISLIWPVLAERRNTRKIDSLQRENASRIKVANGWTWFFGSLAVFFFVAMLIASRKTA